jgi:predicted branched-subunit amino acid permease
VFVGWNATTLLGALVGNLLGDTRAYGLDAAAAAAFLGLIWPRLKGRQAVAVGVGAAVVAAATTPVLMPGAPVIVAALVAVLVGVFNWWERPPQAVSDTRGTASESPEPGGAA